MDPRALLEAQREETQRRLAALDRLDAGSYGTCEQCGDAIGAGRLEARPVARLCITCAARR